MIDDLEKLIALMEKMQAVLPMQAVTTRVLHRSLQERLKHSYPRECTVTEIRYMGDEGGIMCHLDFGFSDSGDAHIVSIAHLTFDRKNPLAREIGGYRKRRIKRLKKLPGGMPSP